MKLQTANERHLPFGEMRAVLRSILRDTPVVPAAPPTPVPIRWPTEAPTSAPVPIENRGGVGAVLAAVLLAFVLIIKSAGTKPGASPPTFHTFQPVNIPEYKIPDLKLPEYKPFQFDTDPRLKVKQDAELRELWEQIHKGEGPGPLFDPRHKAPVVPPPRAVERPGDPGTNPDER
ncbi:MAG: hypothetical protein J0I06_13265 [Planctomycetes bacterium]|nr:hypothetical protein [Planctomycetota bacterium]